MSTQYDATVILGVRVEEIPPELEEDIDDYIYAHYDDHADVHSVGKAVCNTLTVGYSLSNHARVDTTEADYAFVRDLLKKYNIDGEPQLWLFIHSY